MLMKNSSLDEIQNYFSDIFKKRGFNDDSIESKMLLLTEEIGELAKALRKDNSDLGVDVRKIENYHMVKEEVADVFFVLLSICLKCGINLSDAVIEKEMLNEKKKMG